MHIAVIGTGGVGGYFGGRLAAAGEDLTFIARGAQLTALQTHGLRIESMVGDAHIAPVQVTDDPATVGMVDIVLVAVKAWQVPEVAPQLAPLIGPATGVLPLENGVEAAEQLAAVLGREHVLAGVARIFSAISAPGVIHHTGTDAYVALGELDNYPSERAVQFRDALTHAGITAVIPEDIHGAVWEKFIFLTALSGVAAVTRATAGVVRSLPGTRQMLLDAMHETAAVAQANNVALDDEVITRALAIIDALPEAATPSMQRDILAGRPSELEAQNGAVVRLGAATGIATPTHAFIYYALLPQEQQARAAT